MSLIGLVFAICESCKALIFKGLWRTGKTPKAGVAGSIPAGRTKKAQLKSVSQTIAPLLSLLRAVPVRKHL
jgi:hypothetical protein